MGAVFAAEGIAAPALLASQIVLLLDGSFAVVLLHRDAAYMEAAGDAAFVLVTSALAGRARGRRRGGRLDTTASNGVEVRGVG
jgi:hypothetical protein